MGGDAQERMCCRTRPGVAAWGGKAAMNARLPGGSGQALGAFGWPHQCQHHKVTNATCFAAEQEAIQSARLFEGLPGGDGEAPFRLMTGRDGRPETIGSWHFLYPGSATFYIAIADAGKCLDRGMTLPPDAVLRSGRRCRTAGFLCPVAAGPRCNLAIIQ